MAATSTTEATDGPVMSLINKRIRNLRKKYKRIIQIEEAVAQGKPINKEQEDVLHSKPGVCVLIDELEKLRSPLSVAVSEEVDFAVQRHHGLSLAPPPQQQSTDDDSAKARVFDDGEIRATVEEARNEESNLSIVEDLLNLLYFGSLFDVKTQNDFTSMMFTRTHERGSCLTYDCVTDDDSTDLLGERDLDLISMLGGLVISRPVDSSLSHKNALQRCIEHAKRWIANSNQPIDSDSTVTYAGLRERLTKIMATDYFTTTPEMKAPVDVAAVAAAAGNYTSFQVSGHASMGVPVQVEGSVDQYQDDDAENNQGHESSGGSQRSHEEELQKVHSEEFVMENPTEVVSAQHEIQEAEVEEYQRDESKEQQYIPRRTYPNQRGGRGGGGGGGGRRGYSNGRGRNGSRGGGPYQNGRNQFYDQPTNYYPRNYNNNRGRGGRGGGGHSFNNHGSAGHAAPVDVGSVS